MDGDLYTGCYYLCLIGPGNELVTIRRVSKEAECSSSGSGVGPCSSWYRVQVGLYEERGHFL